MNLIEEKEYVKNLSVNVKKQYVKTRYLFLKNVIESQPCFSCINYNEIEHPSYEEIDWASRQTFYHGPRIEKKCKMNNDKFIFEKYMEINDCIHCPQFKLKNFIYEQFLFFEDEYNKIFKNIENKKGDKYE